MFSPEGDMASEKRRLEVGLNILKGRYRLSFVSIQRVALTAAFLLPAAFSHAAVPKTANGMYDMTTVNPMTIGSCSGENPGCSGVYGMDWLSDGRMVLLTSDFQGHNPRPRDGRARSKVSLVSGLPNGPVTIQDISTHFKLPAGVVVVNDKIWVTDMDTIYRIPTNSPDTSGNAAADSLARMNNRERRIAAPLPTQYNGHQAPLNFAFPEGASGCWVPSGQSNCTNQNSNSHHYIFTPFYHQGKFYASYGGATATGTGKSNLVPSSFFAGALLSWDSSTTVFDSTLHRAAGGFRSPAGSGMGPDGSIYVGDNQGSWTPMNTITRIKPFTNQFAGYRQENGYEATGAAYSASRNFPPNWAQAAYDRGAMVYEPPIAINTYDNSTKTGWVALGQPYFLSQGPYAGDLLVGDINSRGLWRVALDSVADTTGNTNVQGAVFYFTPGSSSQTTPALGTGNNGMIRITQGPDGTIYAGALRGVGNWGSGPASNMLYVFKPKTSPSHFEVRRIRSLVDGYELILNKKVDPATVRKDSFSVGQRSWTRQAGYGFGMLPVNAGNTTNGTPQYTNRPITSLKVSADSMRIRLVVPGIKRINQDKRGDTVTHWHTQFKIQSNLKSAANETMYTTEAAYAQNWIGSRTWTGDTLTIPAPPPDTDTVVSVMPQKISMLGNKVWLTGGARVIRVHVDVMQAFEVILTDFSGRVLARKSGSNGEAVEFKAPYASQGVYLVKVRSQGETYMRAITF
jgi:hypothetical protein